MNTEYYTLADVSRMLQTAPHRIIYLLTTRQVAEPALRIAGRRVYTMEEIQLIAKKLGVEVDRKVRGRKP